MSMQYVKFVAIVAFLLAGSCGLASDDAVHGQILATLRKPHPRLIILPENISSIKQNIERDASEKELFDVLKHRADEMLDASAAVPSAKHSEALASSRLALKHITTLAGMYRLTGDEKYAVRCKQEMLEIAAWNEWGSTNFLCVAEMTAAMSIGYDWLYEHLSADERNILRQAIVKNGLQPGLAQYQSNAWWTTAATNWNLVCNSGLSLGALVVADDEPDLADKILKRCLESVPFALKTFGPDGGWPEGPGYWAYGTRYLTYLLAGLQSSLGSDWNFADKPGVSETGFFRIYSEGPLGLSFNFADSETEVPRGAQMFWFARRYNQPVFAGAEMHVSKIFPEMFHLLFYEAEHPTPADVNLPLNKIFSNINVAFFRSAWADPNAFFVGFKGGDNRWSHAHADLGSFVFDAGGQRWGEDLGPDDYDLPGYFKEQHFSYYRLQTQAHNTLTIDSANQPKNATAKFIQSSVSEHNPFAVVNLKSAYDDRLAEIKRGVALIDKKQLLVQDEFQSRTENPVTQLVWHFHTRADVTLLEGGRKALLKRGKGENAMILKAEILSCPDAVFAVERDKAPQGQAQQSDVSDLTIKINPSKQIGLTTLAVAFSIDNLKPPTVKPLKQW